jgi:chromosome segregation ATPase
MSEEAQGVSPNHDDNAAPSVAPEAETEQVEASAAENTEAPKKRNGVQERINKLTTKNYEERQRNAQLEERIKTLESSQPATPAKPDLAAPNEDDFNTHSEYQSAHAKFVAEAASNAAYDRIRAEQASANEVSAQDARQAELNGKKQAFEENLSTKREHFQDFEDVAYGHQFMDMDLAEQIFEMDKGPEVAYFLGANLDEAARIHALNPVQRARELTKLEFQTEALNPKIVSDAPNPINTLGNSEVVLTDPEKMSADEWRTWRNKQVHG